MLPGDALSQYCPPTCLLPSFPLSFLLFVPSPTRQIQLLYARHWNLKGKAADIFVDKLAWEGREGDGTLWPGFPELLEWILLQVWQLWLAGLGRVTYPIFSIQLFCSQVQPVQCYWTQGGKSGMSWFLSLILPGWFVSIRISVAVIKHQKQLGKERVYFII